MDTRTTKKRFSGIQDMLKKVGTDGCLFLCLCSIIEEVMDAPCDFLGIVRLSMEKGYLTEDFTVENSLAILYEYTGRVWKRTSVEKLPVDIKDNQYTVEIWYNENTKFTHFRRRCADTLRNSITVRDGTLIGYYIYEY